MDRNLFYLLQKEYDSYIIILYMKDIEEIKRKKELKKEAIKKKYN